MANPSDTELRFQEVLQAVFGPRCGGFSPALRESLRQLYQAAREDGALSQLQGEGPVLTAGTDVEHFHQLQAGMFIENDYLVRNNQVRKVLASTVQSVVVDRTTGQPVAEPATYTQVQFNTYRPYRAALPPKSDDAAA
jgi:hypothetical protein